MPNFEPTLALNGGSDGLEKILGLCARIRDKLRKHPTSRFMPKCVKLVKMSLLLGRREGLESPPIE